MALEWGEYNIRVNGIAPGPIADTPGFTKLSGGVSDSAAAKMMRCGLQLLVFSHFAPPASARQC